MVSHAAVLAGMLVAAFMIFAAGQASEEVGEEVKPSQVRLALSALGMGAWIQAIAASVAVAFLLQFPPVWRGAAALAAGAFAIHLATVGTLPNWG